MSAQPTERCPVCHRRVHVNQDGRFAPHDSGSQQCSGSGRMFVSDDARNMTEAVRSLFVSMASLLTMLDGWSVHQDPADGYRPDDVEAARAVLFTVGQVYPYVMDGTNYCIAQWSPEPEAQATMKLSGPVWGSAEDTGATTWKLGTPVSDRNSDVQGVVATMPFRDNENVLRQTVVTTAGHVVSLPVSDLVPHSCAGCYDGDPNCPTCGGYRG